MLHTAGGCHLTLHRCDGRPIHPWRAVGSLRRYASVPHPLGGFQHPSSSLTPHPPSAIIFPEQRQQATRHTQYHHL